MVTDAISSGWEAQVKDLLFQGSWNEESRRRSSNHRELEAILQAIRQALPVIRGTDLKIASDNVTAFVNRQGGTRSGVLNEPLKSDLRASRGQSEINIGSTHKGQGQSGGRLPEPSSLTTGGMVPESESVLQDNQTLGSTRGRFIRHKKEQTGQAFLLPRPERSTVESGCFLNKVELQPLLCISTSVCPPESSKEDKARSGQSHSQKSMVLNTEGTIDIRPLDPPRESRSPLPGPSIPPADCEPPSDGLEFKRRILREKGLSD
ncbi:hypothetical protein GDO81_026129 [Engystomops pustulosus]|uniref:Uncharacterized protein n=1 Tax=Engystomops pustulosus TaxID=76066 RepID=A0AAV6ZSW5_ENGPU|nr:hypothetical protein GDO81_026129 [Engystomops pustulosus]